MNATTTISSDADFKAILDELPLGRQRLVGKLFIEHVIDLTDDPRVRQATVLIDSSATSPDFADSYKVAKAAATDSYTICGNEGDWRKQAGHFVAAAAVSCLTPQPQSGREANLAWNTAMNARMARVCEKIEQGTSADDEEAEHQHRILESFLKT